jgi:flagellar basal-body rod protein FlgG
MTSALQVAATGMRAYQTQIDVISNNVANINTAGFRRETVSYAALVSGMAATDANGSAQGLPQGHGAGAVAEIRRSVEPGALRATGDALNVAIDGTGFLEVFNADGSLAYTRGGALKILPDGQLATFTGLLLAARIAVPPDATSLLIDQTGRVTATVGDQTAAIDLGQLDAVSFTNPAGLVSAGQGLYVASEDSGAPLLARFGEAGMGLLKQGYLEQSNVDLSNEMVDLLVAQRAFEMNSRVLQVADQIMAMTNALPRT